MMADDALPAELNSLFQQWKEFLDAGHFKTSTEMMPANQELAALLQQRIDDFVTSAANSIVDDETTQTALGRVQQMLAQRQANEPPVSIVAHTVLEELGSGGMGVVYKVKDQFDRLFAMKVAKADKISPTNLKRFQEEAKTIHELEHDHIVKIHHFFEYDGIPCYLMPIYPKNLNHLIEEWRRAPRYRAIVRQLIQVTSALGYIHRQKLVHRDIKPNNILIDDRGQLAISDFGLVKYLANPEIIPVELPSSDPPLTGETALAVEAAVPGKTVLGAVFGTKKYMAPEQAAGLNHMANPRWDIFSFGVLMYFIFTGRYPQSSAGAHLLLKPDTSDNEPPQQHNPELPNELNRIVCKCLARHEADRYANGDELTRDLQRWLNRPKVKYRVLIGTCSAMLVGLVALGVAQSLKAKPNDEDRPGASVATGDPKDEVVPGGRDFNTINKQALQMGQTAIIVADKGLPNYSKVTFGEERYRPFVDAKDGLLTIDCGRTVIMQLMDAVPIESYEISCEVKQNSQGARDAIALYALGTPIIRDDKTGEGCLSLSYREWPDDEHCQFDIVDSTIWKRHVKFGLTPQNDVLKTIKERRAKINDWHRLTIIVNKQQARAFLMLDERLLDQHPLPLNPWEGNEFTPYNSQGRVGLAVSSGNFSVRNFLVKPLAPQGAP